MIFFDDNEGQPWTITFGNKIEMLSLLFVLSYFLTTTRDNFGQHFLEIEMLSMLSCFFDDNERQPWTTLFGNRNIVFVVVFF